MEALIQKIAAASQRKVVPEFRIGDVVRVHQRIREGGKERVQVFEGVVIARKHGTGINGTFTVRRIASGIGVERIYPLHSPAIAKIERLRSSKVRRAKLYFLRDRVGKKAKLKGWEAYASWSEDDAQEEESVEGNSEVSDEQTDETIPNEESEAQVESKPEEVATDEQPAEATGESGGETGGAATPEEKASDSEEKSQD